MKVYECGHYDGRENEEFNSYLKAMWDKCEDGVNNKEIMNEIREVLDETRFINLAKFTDKENNEFFIIKVFDIMADENTICKAKIDENGCYIEI